MSAELNFFDTYILMAIVEEIVPKQTFFKDRYFPTGDDDIFASDKVLTEYRKGDRKMAACLPAPVIFRWNAGALRSTNTSPRSSRLLVC